MIACLPGEKDRLITAEWTSDSDHVVLEVPQEGTKAKVDADRSTWRSLLQEMESEAEIVDVTINSHDLKGSIKTMELSLDTMLML